VTSTFTLPGDADVREQVLKPGRSFLVQAPAGSGKTELLIQRYLTLLAVVDEPEEILAITFTRKAAAEMRARVMSALSRARAGDEPDASHLQTGYRCALAVVERERRLDWQLETQPNRLRISTIDSINTRLARRAPLSAGPTSSNAMVEDAERLYRAAARDTIYHAGERDHFGAAVTELLRHCDNRVDRLETLLTTMLARRDQWLPMLASGPDGANTSLREYLEHALGTLIEHVLAKVNELIVSHHRDLAALLNYAGASITIENPDSTLARWQDVVDFPAPVVGELNLWRSMADVFLTKQGHWRKTLTKNQGFPADGPQMKADGLDLLQQLSGIEALESVMGEVRQLPSPVYSDRQWSALEALLHVLPLAAANLKQLFSTQRKTDFCEIAQEALASIGAEDQTTALSLSLDYQITHILLDEFQDTSRSQYELLRKLTAGWQDDGSRTLFLVGDPMQSIYRFRQAQVGLFLEAKEKGIGEIKLNFAELTTNFRSAPKIVDWFNDIFKQVMPRNEDEDAAAGAIPFARSIPFEPDSQDSRVSWHVTAYGDTEGEAEQVLSIVEKTRLDYPQDSIAILVRSRGHGANISKRLVEKNIRFASADIELMEEDQVVQDLLALTRALAHCGDRLAWLAVLRAPWCGLTLFDLTALAEAAPKSVIWDLVQERE